MICLKKFIKFFKSCRQIAKIYKIMKIIIIVFFSATINNLRIASTIWIEYFLELYKCLIYLMLNLVIILLFSTSLLDLQLYGYKFHLKNYS